LRLLPGLPRRIFSSSTFFLGGIFLDFAYVRVVVGLRVMRKAGEKVEWRWLEKSRAVLAAGREKVGIKEEKEKVKERVGGVMRGKGRDALQRLSPVGRLNGT